MLKISKTWSLILISVWLLCCQGLFVLVQQSQGQKIVESTQSQLRQELDFSNFHFLSRSLTDFTVSGSIRCVVLEKVKPDYLQVLDLQYMNKGACSVHPIELKGSAFNVLLKSLNGDSYRLKFISNNSIYFYLALWGFRILGIIALLGIMAAMKSIAEKKMLAVNAKIEMAEKLKQLAMQVSHDIRSPLEALKMAMTENTDHANSKIIEASVNRINDIANNLLKSEREKEGFAEVTLNDQIKEVIIEKQYQYKSFSGIEILYHDPGKRFKVRLATIEFKRMLSNLINNAIESIDSEGRVEVTLSEESNQCLLTVRDNGRGIPAHIITQLGKKSLSYGKEGNGLGLTHAKKTVQAINGKIEFRSDLNAGTEIMITIPLIENVSTLNSYDYVYIDDDKAMRLAWSMRAKKNQVDLLTLQSTNDFENYLSKIDKEKTYIYIDSDLGDHEIRGELFAKKLHDLGYKNLHLASGYAAENFELFDGLNYSGKQCPF